MNILLDKFGDISVRFAQVKPELDNAMAQGVLWQATSCSFLLNIPNVARYLVENGTTITIDPAQGADNRIICKILQMTPLAALMYQKGVIAFHAAAVVHKNRTLLLAGRSGAGKSTLLIELLNRGWTMLADDLAIVSEDDHGVATVTPTSSEIILWPDTLIKMGMDVEVHPSCDANRRMCACTNQYETISRPFQAILLLGVHGKNYCEISAFEISDRFRAIGMLQYNSHIADAICDRVTYLRLAANISQTVKMLHLFRPQGAWSVVELANMIEGNT